MTASSQNASVLVSAPRIDLCLDFANTIAWRGSTPEESLHSFADLIGWCVNAGVIPERGAREYRVLEKGDPARAVKIFNDAIALREAIYRVVYSAATSEPVAEIDLGLLNDALKGAPARIKVARAGSVVGGRSTRRAEPRASSALRKRRLFVALSRRQQKWNAALVLDAVLR